jgi:hypothetical protein
MFIITSDFLLELVDFCNKNPNSTFGDAIKGLVAEEQKNIIESQRKWAEICFDCKHERRLHYPENPMVCIGNGPNASCNCKEFLPSQSEHTIAKPISLQDI